MKKALLILALLSYFSSFSQDKKIVLKTNGYHYFESKKLKNQIGNLKWLSSLKNEDTVYSIHPILFDDYGNFSTSDNFYGIINKENNFKGSHKELQKKLKKKSNLSTKGRYHIKGYKIFLEYEAYDKTYIKIKGAILNEETFILTERLTYLNKKLIKKVNIRKVYHYKPYSLKKKYYYNENLKQLTQKEFESNNFNKNYYALKYKKDTADIFIKILAQETGRLQKRTNDSIRKQLANLSKEKIDSNNTIVINYFPESDKCRPDKRWNYSSRLRYKKYLKKIKIKENVSQFFIFKNENSVNNFGKHFKWYLDKNKLFEKTFFKHHYPCGSYVIIRPNGNFYSEKGEYQISLIPDKL